METNILFSLNIKECSEDKIGVKHPVFSDKSAPTHIIITLTQVGHGPRESQLDVLVDDGDVLRGDPDAHQGGELDVALAPRPPVGAEVHLARGEVLPDARVVRAPVSQGHLQMCQWISKYRYNNIECNLKSALSTMRLMLQMNKNDRETVSTGGIRVLDYFRLDASPASL